MEISRSSVWGLELVADRSGCRYYGMWTGLKVSKLGLENAFMVCSGVGVYRSLVYGLLWSWRFAFHKRLDFMGYFWSSGGWYGSMDPLSQVVEGEVLVFKSGVLWVSFFVVRDMRCRSISSGAGGGFEMGYKSERILLLIWLEWDVLFVASHGICEVDCNDIWCIGSLGVFFERNCFFCSIVYVFGNLKNTVLRMISKVASELLRYIWLTLSLKCGIKVFISSLRVMYSANKEKLS